MYKCAKKSRLGVQRAELSAELIQSQTQGGSSKLYVLHRPGPTQEDNQLLHQERRRRDARRRHHRRPAAGAQRLAGHFATTLDRSHGSDAVHRLDLRLPEATRRGLEGGASANAAGHRGSQEEERSGGRPHDRRPVALQSAAGMLHGAQRVSRAAAHPAVSKPAGKAKRSDEESDRRLVDGNRGHLQQRKTSSQRLLHPVAKISGSARLHSTAAADRTRVDRTNRPARPHLDANPGTRSGAGRARRTLTDDSLRRTGHGTHLGAGGWRGQPIFFGQARRELLRAVQRRAQFGRDSKTLPDLQAAQQASANGAGGSRKTLAALQRRAHPAARKSAIERKSQSRHDRRGQKAGGYLLAVDRRE